MRFDTFEFYTQRPIDRVMNADAYVVFSQPVMSFVDICAVTSCNGCAMHCDPAMYRYVKYYYRIIVVFLHLIFLNFGNYIIFMAEEAISSRM